MMNVELPKGVYKNGNGFSVYVPAPLIPTVGKRMAWFDTMEEAVNKREEWSKFLFARHAPAHNYTTYGIDWSFIETSFKDLRGKSHIDKSLLKCVKEQLQGIVCVSREFRFYLSFPDCTRNYVLRTEDDIPFVKDILAKSGYNRSKAKLVRADMLNAKACEEYKKDREHIRFTGRCYILRLPANLPEGFPQAACKMFENYEDAKALRDSLKSYYKAAYNRGPVAEHYLRERHPKEKSTPVVSPVKLEALKCLAHPDTNTHYAEEVYILNKNNNTYTHLGPCSKFEILTSIVKCGTSEVVVLSKSTDGSYKVLNILS